MTTPTIGGAILRGFFGIFFALLAIFAGSCSFVALVQMPEGGLNWGVIVIGALVAIAAGWIAWLLLRQPDKQG